MVSPAELIILIEISRLNWLTYYFRTKQSCSISKHWLTFGILSLQDNRNRWKAATFSAANVIAAAIGEEYVTRP
jgi:hypothetical protein